jgi:hypothetical protein
MRGIRTATTTAAPATGMATNRALLGGLLALSTAASGCGASTGAAPSGAVQGTTRRVSPSPSAAIAAFAWLRPAPAPADWLSARLPTGATMAYPPGWHIVAGDRGTVSAALLDSHGHYLGYLNLTPRQGAETPASWPTFRLRHNAGEGDREVRLAAAAGDLRFRTGRGTCVRDAYTTSANTRYVEIACLVGGVHVSSVLVGAAPSEHWTQEHSVIEQAISALIT